MNSEAMPAGFRHGQYTIEGEIERFGAFARGVRSASGWRRQAAVALAVLLVLLMTVPLVAAAVAAIIVWSTG